MGVVGFGQGVGFGLGEGAPPPRPAPQPAGMWRLDELLRGNQLRADQQRVRLG